MRWFHFAQYLILVLTRIFYFFQRSSCHPLNPDEGLMTRGSFPSFKWCRNYMALVASNRSCDALHHNWITRSILSSARAAETVQSSTQTTLNSICGSNAARNYLFNFQYIRQPSNWFNRWRCFVHVHTIHVHRHRRGSVGGATCLKRWWVLSWPDYDLT